MLAPPYIITEAQLDEAVDKLARSIDEVIAAD
jgi:adenosylmethionine-8-amino-7-oxononanoate aminotransferase